MAYEMVMPYHLHMPSYFLETFTEYPYHGVNVRKRKKVKSINIDIPSSRCFSQIIRNGNIY